MTAPTTPDPGGARGGGSVAVAMGVMSVASYAFTIVAARVLGTQSYGAFAALMGLLLVVNVLALGLQATAARRISSVPEHAREIETVIMRVSRRAGLVLALACLLLSPVTDAVLRLDSLPTAALVALAAFPLTMMGGQAGILQGERRWTQLSLLYLSSGLGRLAVGGVLIAWRPSEFAAMLGVALAAYLPVLLGWWALRRGGPHVDPGSDAPGARELISETVHNSHALLAFFALSNLDVVLARAMLDGHDAGLYAAGLIMTKAVLFLPQFVVVIAFPDMAASRKRNAHLPALGAIALLGLLVTAGTAVLPGLALIFVGGADYEEIKPLIWAFAGLGTLASMLQLMVYEAVARQLRSAPFVMWVALGVLALGALAVDSERQLVVVVAAVYAVCLAVLIVFTARRSRAAAANRVDEPAVRGVSADG
ncbi:oligosaccharide flippase family protein [Nocardioides pantholopis]|uniref:oligosaccharide flippase family protein n=1 Tax=Nocardioides pantholopis TaxID=2483798 RepID=UPI000F08716A|nr:oligosaccharide flippase family protein [Nocardioides pantholopis]